MDNTKTFHRKILLLIGINFDTYSAPSSEKLSLWKAFKIWRTRRRTALSGGCTVAASTLLLNITATVYLYRNSIPDHGIHEPTNPRFFMGDCATASKLNTYLHILINVISTLLLSSSNMFMQLLLAPTRAEVDALHARQQWIDIGIPNLRNLRFVGNRNRFLWFILAFSSLPLHLLYNSAIYGAKPVNHVTMHIVSPEFLIGAPANVSLSVRMYEWRRDQNLTGLERKHKTHRQLKTQTIDADHLFNWNMGCVTNNCSAVQEYAMKKQYTRSMSPIDCLTAYSTIYGNRSDVIFVSRYDYLWNSSTSVPHLAINGSDMLISNNTSKLPNPKHTPLLFAKELQAYMVVGFWMEYEWLCGTTNSFDCRLASSWLNNPTIIKDWNILGWKIDECLVKELPLDDKCSVNYSLEIMIVVCVVNLLKLACMVYSLKVLSHDGVRVKPLSTLGDAISSFLTIEDATTTRLGLMDKGTLENQNIPWDVVRTSNWNRTPLRWYRLVSRRRLLWTFVLGLFIVLGGAGAMTQSFFLITSRSGSVGHILDIGYGTTDQTAFGQLGLDMDVGNLWSMKKGFLSIVFFANMWQLLISLLYLSANALLTCFCVELEWQSYGSRAKSLRVSSPQGQQRSTYFLSLPFRYSLPLMAVFTILHWTLSQSIFLTVVAVYKPQQLFHEMLFLGSSPRPLILTVGVGVIIMLGFVGICFRTSDGILPRGGTCSAVLSAACHGPPGDDNAALKPVQWGEVVETQLTSLVPGQQTYPYAYTAKQPEVSEVSQRKGYDSSVGHCCFTAYEVVLPRAGKLYQ